MNQEDQHRRPEQGSGCPGKQVALSGGQGALMGEELDINTITFKTWWMWLWQT